jgi:uncharacterized protein (UPF0303 family)
VKRTRKGYKGTIIFSLFSFACENSSLNNRDWHKQKKQHQRRELLAFFAATLKLLFPEKNPQKSHELCLLLYPFSSITKVV